MLRVVEAASAAAFAMCFLFVLFLGGGFGNIQSCESWKCLWTWGEEPYILDHAF